jgi:hypothetical protein
MGHEAMCPPPSKQGLYYSRKLLLQLLKHPRSNIRTASDSVPVPGMINMSIHVYFPAPIDYPFSDFRSVCVGGSDPNDVEGVIHRRFGLPSQ